MDCLSLLLFDANENMESMLQIHKESLAEHAAFRWQ